MRGDQLARQWQLIQRLARSQAGVGLKDLADDLGCVRRTVYRDLDALMFAGFPVVSEKRDGRVYYRFLDSFRLGDVPFTADEILALVFGEDLLRTLEGTVFHDSIRSAVAKIRASLGPELSDFLERLGTSFRVLPGPHKRYAQSRETIQRLNQAVLAKRGISMRYHTARSGETADRSFDPYRVWYRNGGLYAIGHDHHSGELRTFAVDRMERVSFRYEDFEIPEDFNFDAYIEDSFGVMSEPAVPIRIRFAADWAVLIEERIWHPSQELLREADGSVLLSMEVGGSMELRNWLLSFGSGAEILAPENLRREVAEELARAAARYLGDAAEPAPSARKATDPGPTRHAPTRS